jgi:hypothetical protein
MSELRDVLRRRMDQVDFRPMSIERIYANRDRRRRNQRLRAGTLAVAIAGFAILALSRALPWASEPLGAPSPTAETPSPEPDASGIPSSDVARSTPTVGNLLLWYDGSEEAGNRMLFLYEDGRLLQPDDPDWTSWSELRITPEGAALLHGELLATGLFDRARRFDGGSHPKVTIQTLNDANELVLVGTYGDLGPDEDWPKETDAQAAVFRHLESILADPIAWLPGRTVIDDAPRPFVASRYFVEFSFPLMDFLSPPRPSDLPPPIDGLLKEADTSGRWGACKLLMPAEARRAVRDLRVAFGGRGDPLSFLDNGEHPFSVGVRPALPHETSCAT